MEYKLEPTNAHVVAYSKMWLNSCSNNCEFASVCEKYVRLDHAPWSRTEYECTVCGNRIYEKSWRDVLEEFGDADD